MRAAERLKSRCLVPTISSVPLEEVWKATKFLGCLWSLYVVFFFGKDPKGVKVWVIFAFLDLV